LKREASSQRECRTEALMRYQGMQDREALMRYQGMQDRSIDEVPGVMG